MIIGTHADLLTSEDRRTTINEMDALYSPQNKLNKNQFQGHFAVNLAEKRGSGQSELKSKLLDIGLNHPKIGIGSVKVPRSFIMLRQELDELKKDRPYIYWGEYMDVAGSIGIYNYI